MSPAKVAESLLAQAKSRVGVYVHFPWCLKKCPYCDFLSIAGERQALPHVAYADAVIRELERRAADLGPLPLGSVFFGGGTPSLWQPSELGRVLERIFAAFPQRRGSVEVTAECNPSSFDSDRARALLDVGVNRVSIGVQSLSAQRLQLLGRLHDVDGGLQAVRDAVAAGVPRVSADLIFGVHGQSPEQAAREARTVAELGPTHVSDYALTIEPGTEFGARARKNALPLLPDDAVADSFLAVDETLCSLGYEHYEISNYARDEHRSDHNLGYWLGHQYLGLGCGAWGTVIARGARVRYRNTPSPDRYLSVDWSRVDLERASPSSAQVERELISDRTALSERIMLGLRLAEGLDLDAAGADLAVDPWDTDRVRAAMRLVERGRLQRDGSVLKIPKHAWLFADGTIAELL